MADPPTLHRGDLVDDLASVAGTLPSDRPLVVFHSWVAAYLTEQRQAELVEAVRAAGPGAPGAPPLRRVALRDHRASPLPRRPSPVPVDLVTALVHLPPDGDTAATGRPAPPWPVAAVVGGPR